MAEKKHITIQDIAQRAGISKATVSRFLNGKYEYMSEATRQRIEQIILETNYRPNKVASSLKTSKTDLISLVLSNPATNLTPFIVGSICDYCAFHGQKLIVVTTHGDTDLEQQQIRSLLDRQVDGIIVATGSNHDFYCRLHEDGYPIVLVDRVPPNSILDWVAINHYEATATVIDHLISQGYERIVLVRLSDQSDITSSTIQIREKSVEDTCLFRFGNSSHCEKILIDQDAVWGNDNSDSQIMECLKHYHAEGPRCPTAIFATNGVLLGRLICGFFQLGMQISPSFTLAGYDAWNFGNFLGSQICTIDQPLQRMGTLASELLIDRIRQKELPDRIHRLLDCRVNLAAPFSPSP